MTRTTGPNPLERLIERKDSKAPERILILVGYSYYFESFFLSLVSGLSEKFDFDVWFDENPAMFSKRDYEQAVSLVGSFGIGQVQLQPLSVFWDEERFERPKEWLADVKSNVARLADVARSRSYSAVIVMNSALLTILPVVTALRDLNLKVVVVRSTILESPLLRLLRDFFPDGALSPLKAHMLRANVAFGTVFSYFRKVLIALRSAAIWSKSRERLAPKKAPLVYLKGFIFGLLRGSPVSIAFLMRVFGVKRPVLSAVESEYSVANSRLTDLVLIPGGAHLKHLEQLFPGPNYRGYTSFFEEEDRRVTNQDRSLNIILPLSSETSAAALSLFSEVVEALSTAQEWSVFRYRRHPRELPNQPNSFLAAAQKHFPIATENVSGLSFQDFSSLGGRFFVIGSSSAITSLSFFSPSSKIGVLSLDGGEQPGEDGRYLEGFGNSRLLRTPEDAESWVSESSPLAAVSRDDSLITILRRELSG